MTDTDTLHIHSLKVQNFMRLNAVEVQFTPSGIVEITGRNAQGKSSFLRAVDALLRGKVAMPDEPIREGTDEATIVGDLGEIVVRRTIKRSKDGEGWDQSVTVESTDGAKYGTPQKLLDSMLSVFALDPIKFKRAAPAEQLAMLRKFVTGFDFNKSDLLNRGDYEARTECNRRAKDARSRAGGITIHPDTPTAPVDSAVAAQRLQDAMAANANSGAARSERATLERQKSDKFSMADGLRTQAKQLAAQADNLEKEGNALATKIAEMGDPPVEVDIAPFQRALNDVERLNREYAQRQQRDKFIAEAEDADKQAQAHTEAMERRDAEKRAAIAAATFPVPGLSLGDDCVLLNGQPFAQASAAEQWVASAALAMADSPKCRIMLVPDASLLDEDSFNALAKLAKERDYQVIAETVNSCGRVAVEICDGRVKETEVQP